MPVPVFTNSVSPPLLVYCPGFFAFRRLRDRIGVSPISMPRLGISLAAMQTQAELVLVMPNAAQDYWKAPSLTAG